MNKIVSSYTSCEYVKRYQCHDVSSGCVAIGGSTVFTDTESDCVTTHACASTLVNTAKTYYL